MQTRGSSRRNSDEQLLDSGLYCDFPDSSGKRRDSNDNRGNNNSSSNSNNRGAAKEGGFGGAIRRFIKKGPSSVSKSSTPVEAKPVKSSAINYNSSSSSNNNNNILINNDNKNTDVSATSTAAAKPRRRRGSHMMSEGGGKMPTSAELMAQKQKEQQQIQLVSEGGGNGGQKLPTSAELLAHKQQAATAPVTIKSGSKKPGGRRRGSHMMADMGGQKMPTSAELMALKQQQAVGGDGEGGGREPMETDSIVTATTTITTTNSTTSAKPRRGSHMMPDMGGQKMRTSAEMMGQNQNQASSSYTIPQDVDQPKSAVTIKMGSYASGLSNPRSTSLYADNGPSPMDTSDSPSPTSGRTRARRRGSVVKTMVDSDPKNVDGDGEHIAKSSTSPEAQSETYAKLHESMMSIDDDNAQSSLEYQEMVHVNEGAVFKDTSIKSIESPTIGDSSRSSESATRLQIGGKKKDRGRKAIRAVAADLDYVHKVVPKSNEAKALIYDAIKPNILFRACSPEELYDLVDAFEPQYVPIGSVVIQEGDEGDHFYVVEKGGVDVFEKDIYKCSLYSGVAFGEIALLYSCPRTATVQAKYDSKMWVINRRAFRGIMAQHKKRRLELKSDFLKKVKIHDKVLGDILESSEINSIALATKDKKFKAGNVIVRQGERGDAFYIIEDGEVDVYINEKGARPVATLKKGSFFGEKALLSSDTRTATCVASTNVKCLMLMREDFVLMLGNLQDLLDRSYIARDEEASKQKSPYPTTRRFDINDYEIKRTLGVGAFGFVKLVKWKKAPKGQEDQYYALKCVSKQKIVQHKQQEKIKREEDIMKELIHPFIARLYSGMEDEKGKYFLMEALCGGELCELLYNETQFSERWSLFYSASVLLAFGHMHERKIAYRDLKPENLVLDTYGYVKIVDFGLAKTVKEGQTYTFCGTPDYLAPEVILNEGYDWGVDYWGLGVLIYEMTAGVAPFYAESPMETYEKALSGHVFIPAHFSRSAANLIKKLLHTSQSKRLGRTVGGAITVMSHPWYSHFDWGALIEYRLKPPYLPEARDPDDNSSMVDEEQEGFATAFF